jgi:hypothetical protein
VRTNAARRWNIVLRHGIVTRMGGNRSAGSVARSAIEPGARRAGAQEPLWTSGAYRRECTLFTATSAIGVVRLRSSDATSVCAMYGRLRVDKNFLRKLRCGRRTPCRSALVYTFGHRRALVRAHRTRLRRMSGIDPTSAVLVAPFVVRAGPSCQTGSGLTAYS